MPAQPQGLFGAPRRLPQISPELGAMIRQDAGMGGAQLQQPAQPQKRDTLRRIAGYFADFTAGLAGQTGPYASMLAEQQALAEKQRQASLERETDWQDWVEREEWKRANPTAPNNDTVADYEFIRGRLGDEAAAEFLRNKANPPVYRVGPDGQFYRVDTATPPARPVGRLTPIEESTGSNAGGGFRP